MRITIDTDILKKRDIGLDEFLLLLLFFYGYNYKDTFKQALKHGFVSSDLFKDGNGVLSDNVCDLVVRTLMASDDKIKNCPIKDFHELAKNMQCHFPRGNKSGTSYSWTGDTDEIAFKLMMLVVKYNFFFTESEAIEATKIYVSDSKDDLEHMALLKYFIIKTHIKDNEVIISSPFMSIIENNRNNEISN